MIFFVEKSFFDFFAKLFAFGHPNWRHFLYFNNGLSLDNLSSFATAHVYVSIGWSESSTFVVLLAYGKAVTECSPARLVLGTTTKNPLV